MRTVNPSMESIKSPAGNLRQQKSTFQALNGGLTYGSPTGTLDATGCYDNFSIDNVNNAIFRIGANGSSNGQYQWSSGGSVTINHGLQRQPIGFKILDKDGACDVYRTGGAPTKDFITLSTSVNSINMTVEIF